jgi:hypothetical protein
MANQVTYVHHRMTEFKAFKSPTGMVGRYVETQAEKVAAHARLLAPKKTGKLAANIRTRGPVIGRSGPESEVVADVDYSLHVHEPTIPHRIKPRAANKLVFFSQKAGTVIFTEGVMHPGTRGNPFLVKALAEVFGGPGR